MASLKELLNRFHLDKVRIKTGFVDAEIHFSDVDKTAAWELYIELLTRISTQYLPPEDGDEKSALDSIFALFKLTREIIKKNGPRSINFTRIAIVVLNQVIRPFTARWHRLSLGGAFNDPHQCGVFREELRALQASLRNYTRLLAEMAGVEDLTDLEEEA